MKRYEGDGKPYTAATYTATLTMTKRDALRAWWTLTRVLVVATVRRCHVEWEWGNR
jgi:hypothetical protein